MRRMLSLTLVLWQYKPDASQGDAHLTNEQRKGILPLASYANALNLINLSSEETLARVTFDRNGCVAKR